MQLGDPKNAAAAFDILSDYFNNNFSELKQSDKRHGKRRQLLAEPLQETASNPSLRSPLGLNKHDKCGDASSVLSDLSVTPIIQRNRTHVSKPAVSSEASSELSVKSAFSKKPDLHVEDYHNVADLVHRLTQRTGLQPGQVRVTKTPDSVAEKAAHIADLQYKELRYSDRMQQILAELMVVNTRLTSIVPAVAGHRRDWGKIVEDSNHVYLRLFESMMSEILLIHRKKFKVTAGLSSTSTPYVTCRCTSVTDERPDGAARSEGAGG